jgi:2'-5' RNA ligase
MTDGAPVNLFFGLFPDPPARKALANVARAASRDTGGRVPRAERIHLTLVYLGSTLPERIATVKALAASVRAPAFLLRLTELEWWRSNEIVYAAPDDGAALTFLVQALTLKLSSGGIKGVRQRFVPHITLVREAGRAPTENMAPVEWRVDRFALVHSILVPGKIRYELLAEFLLDS